MSPKFSNFLWCEIFSKQETTTFISKICSYLVLCRQHATNYTSFEVPSWKQLLSFYKFLVNKHSCDVSVVLKLAYQRWENMERSRGQKTSEKNIMSHWNTFNVQSDCYCDIITQINDPTVRGLSVTALDTKVFLKFREMQAGLFIHPKEGGENMSNTGGEEIMSFNSKWSQACLFLKVVEEPTSRAAEGYWSRAASSLKQGS